MEKPPKAMTKIFSFLPRAASSVIAFHNLPFSPGRDNHNKPPAPSTHRFSGPLIPNDTLTLDGPEPTSPKISCMGQIKHKKGKIKVDDRGTKRGTTSKLRRIFSAKLEKKSAPLAREEDGSRLPDRTQTLSQAKRFASRRDVLADFDWSAVPFTPPDRELRNYYSDEDERPRTSNEDEDDEDVMVRFSAPLPVGAVAPRKEVNLWKREDDGSSKATSVAFHSHIKLKKMKYRCFQM